MDFNFSICPTPTILWVYYLLLHLTYKNIKILMATLFSMLFNFFFCKFQNISTFGVIGLRIFIFLDGAARGLNEWGQFFFFKIHTNVPEYICLYRNFLFLGSGMFIWFFLSWFFLYIKKEEVYVINGSKTYKICKFDVKF